MPKALEKKWRRQIADGAWPGQKEPEVGAYAPHPLVFRWWRLDGSLLKGRCVPASVAAGFPAFAFGNELNMYSLVVAMVLVIFVAARWPRRERVDRWVSEQSAAV